MPVAVAEKIIRTMKDNVILHFDVPTMAHYKTELRRSQIADYFNDGMRVKDIARKMRLTERAIYLSLAALRQDGRLAEGNKRRLELSALRNEEARKRHADGESVDSISAALGVSEKTIEGYLEDD